MSAVDFWSPRRPGHSWRRIDRAAAVGAGWQVYVPPAHTVPAPEPVDCQPLARLEADGRYRPTCRCGWKGVQAYQLRAEALVMVRVFHETEPEPRLNT